MAPKEHVLAEEKRVSAARTKQHEEEKHTGIKTDKNMQKKGNKEKKQANRAQSVDSNKASRLCYKVESSNKQKMQ